MIQTAIVVAGLLIGITAFPTLAFASRRIEYDVPVNATSRAGIERARRGIVRAIGETDGVLADPRPDVLVVALGDSAVTLRARW